MKPSSRLTSVALLLTAFLLGALLWQSSAKPLSASPATDSTTSALFAVEGSDQNPYVFVTRQNRLYVYKVSYGRSARGTGQYLQLIDSAEVGTKAR